MPKHVLQTLIMMTLSFATMTFADEVKPENKVTYNDHVLPVFRQRCGSCHNGNDQKGGLALDTYTGVMTGGASGETPKPGEADSSYLLDVITHKSEPVMPPKSDKIPEKEIALIRDWINQGLLETSSSKAQQKKKNNLGMSVISSGRPPGESILPANYPLEATHVILRPCSVSALATSPWAPVAAYSGHKQIFLIDTEFGDSMGVLSFPEGIPEVLKFSRNGKLLLSAGGRSGQSGKVVLFDVQTGNRIAEVGAEFDTVLAADVSADQTRVALGGPKRMVRVYDPRSGELVFEKKKHTDWVTSMEFSPDGVLLATGDRSSGLIVWEASTGAEFLVLNGHKQGITSVSWRPDSNILASASEDGEVKLWELNEGNNIKSWKAHDSVQAIQFTREGKILTVGRDKLCKLFDGEGKELKQYKNLPEMGMNVAYDAELNHVIAGDYAGNIKVWNAESAQELYTVTTNPEKFSTRIDALKLSIEQLQISIAAGQKQQQDLKLVVEARAKAFEAAKIQVSTLEQSFKTAGDQHSLAKSELEKAKQDEKQTVENQTATDDQKKEKGEIVLSKENELKSKLEELEKIKLQLENAKTELAKADKEKDMKPEEKKALEDLAKSEAQLQSNLSAPNARMKKAETRLSKEQAKK